MRKLVFVLLALISIQAHADADWLSPGGMTQIMDGVDDATYHVPLGHSFPYYGGVFTDAWMSTNGFILLYDPVNQFGNPDTWNSMCCSGQDLANSNHGGQFSFMLAPLWTDLIDKTQGADSGYFYKTNEGVSSFLWYNVNEFYNDNKNTFQVNLWPDGSFDFLYDEVDITQHNTFIGFTGNVDYGEVTQLGYYQGSVTEFDIDFYNQTVNGGRAWYGDDGGYKSTLDCSNSLNDPNCPGYEQAYYEQQCSYDALYDYGCSGYEQAYYEQQCYYDALYDSTCSGYDNAILVQDLSGRDFVFGDDISDFYDNDLIEERNSIFSSYEEENSFTWYEEETNMSMSDMFTWYEEETNIFPEPEVYEERIEETYFEETYFEEHVEEVFFDEHRTVVVREEIYEEEIFEEFEESLAEELVQIRERITHIEEDMGSIEEELPITEIEVRESVVERENLVRETVEASAPKIDAVSIALTTASDAQSSSVSFSSQQNESSTVALQSFVSSTVINQTSNAFDIISPVVAAQTTSAETDFQNFNMSLVSSGSPQSVGYDSLNEDSPESETIVSPMTFNRNNSFTLSDSAFGDATTNMMVDPSITAVEISAISAVQPAVQPVTEQATQEEQTVEFQMESSTAQTDGGFAQQQNQSFSTGQSITAVLNNVAPNFSRFDVTPPSQQEQQTTNRAESQANNMSDEQLADNLDEFSNEMKDSGGFSDQSMTIFLMGRVNGFDQYGGQLQDTSFYVDKGMPGSRVQNDRNSMLQLIGTDNKHEELVSLQYGR